MRKIAIAVLLCLPFTALARDVVVEGAGGGINWTEGYVWADGFGVAPDGAADRKKRLLARRAAQVDAYRNLAEFVEGVRVSSESVVRQMVLDSDVVRTKIDAVVKGATMVRDHYQNDVAQVTLRINLDGDFSSTTSGALIKASTSARHAPGSLEWSPIAVSVLEFASRFLVSPVHAQSSGEPLIQSDADADFVRRLLLEAGNRPDPAGLFGELQVSADAWDERAGYTGLLVDARDVAEFQLATIPRIRDPEGNVIYPSDDLLRNDLQARRPVSYDFSVDDAIRNHRVSQKPRMIKARGVFRSRNSDLVISEQDAEFIRGNQRFRSIINGAGVMIVVSE